MTVYDTPSAYLQTCKSISQKIAAIDAIIDALLLTAADAAATDNITSYQLDDGQTKINCMYKGTASIYQSIASFRKLRTSYENESIGHTFRLVDGKNFNNCSDGRY